MSITLTKGESLNRINLNKEKVAALCAKNTALANLTSRVGLVLDFSGSMRNLYANGVVQDVVEAILPLAMQFDDNGEMECWIFDNGFHRLENISLSNFYGYVENVYRKYSMGGTNYAPVINDVYKKYIRDEPSELPAYVIFITDGDNADHTATDSVICYCSEKPIFFQFVGIGSASFSYLEHLDNMSGRYADNANFLKVKNISDITYEALLTEYPSWLEDDKVKAMLRR